MERVRAEVLEPPRRPASPNELRMAVAWLQELSKLIGPRDLTLETHNIQDPEALADLVSALSKPWNEQKMRWLADNPPPLLPFAS